MEKVNLSISIEDEKLEAMEIFLKKGSSSVQKKMEEALKNLYEEVVPEPVREFVEAKAGGKPKRITPQSKPKSDQKPKIEQKKEAPSHE